MLSGMEVSETTKKGYHLDLVRKGNVRVLQIGWMPTKDKTLVILIGVFRTLSNIKDGAFCKNS